MVGCVCVCVCVGGGSGDTCIHTHTHVSFVFQRKQPGILVLIALRHGRILVARMLAGIGVVSPFKTVRVELGDQIGQTTRKLLLRRQIGIRERDMHALAERKGYNYIPCFP